MDNIYEYLPKTEQNPDSHESGFQQHCFITNFSGSLAFVHDHCSSMFDP